jgi:predicted phosphodiesterase
VKIALLSDTHSFLDPLCVKHCETADEIFHAGDIGDVSVLEQLQKIKPTSAVYGNFDGQLIRSCSPRFTLPVHSEVIILKQEDFCKDSSRRCLFAAILIS